MRSRCLIAYTVLLYCLSVSAQTGVRTPLSNGTETQPTFHATTRLVLVDVVVTNKKSEFVRNLKSTDFTVLEDGRLQTLTAFTPHSSTDAMPAKPHPPLPEHQFTNYSTLPPGHPITIVLLDMLNTVIAERPYARQQMIKFLSSLPTGQPVALFTLGGNLKMVQGFTQSSDALVAAAKAILDKNESARLNTSEEDLENAESLDAEFASMMSIGGRQSSASHLAQALKMNRHIRSTYALRRHLTACEYWRNR